MTLTNSFTDFKLFVSAVACIGLWLIGLIFGPVRVTVYCALADKTLLAVWRFALIIDLFLNSIPSNNSPSIISHCIDVFMPVKHYVMYTDGRSTSLRHDIYVPKMCLCCTVMHSESIGGYIRRWTVVRCAVYMLGMTIAYPTQPHLACGYFMYVCLRLFEGKRGTRVGAEDPLIYIKHPLWGRGGGGGAVVWRWVG